MARKKITLALIENKTYRKASFRKRRKGLIKKVREISTLCDVEACDIIFSPYDERTEIWPSPEGAMAVLERYGAAVSGIHHRPPKEMDQESFTLHRWKNNHQKLNRLLMENKRNDLDWFMYQCMAGTNSLHNLDERERAEMSHLINQRIRDVDSRIENLMKGNMMSQLLTPTGPESIGLLWDIEALPYPHLFTGTGSGFGAHR
ncbi:mads-box transcription factor pheres 2 [Phtheirospermum japonicum]|uniref:Mads-box transcription factor pheres 2 n=1 Tax=Phtheirospermum japonicum TaxID=374723 RepID=A0A830B079_9LAMI|nr:mads-box transcription factor pheres 2 [Phtheirospermum japonicum]